MVLSQIFTAPDFNCSLFTVCKSKISNVKKNTFYSKYLYNTICSSKFLQKIKITQLNFSKKNQNQSLSENPKNEMIGVELDYPTRPWLFVLFPQRDLILD